MAVIKTGIVRLLIILGFVGMTGVTAWAQPAGNAANAISYREFLQSLTPAERKIPINLVAAARYANGQPLPASLDESAAVQAREGQPRPEVYRLDGVSKGALLAALAAEGLSAKFVSETRNYVTAVLTPSAVGSLATYDAVLKVSPVIGPMAQGQGSTQAAAVHRLADLYPVDKPDAGDPALTGSGVVVGLISLPFKQADLDALNLEATRIIPDAAALTVRTGGDAISHGSGTLDAVDDTDGSLDALYLLQLIYDMAPGAQVVAASPGGAGSTPGEMATVVNALAAGDGGRGIPGADIIIDDLFFPGQNPFEVDEVSEAITAAREAGVLYITAAGDNGQAGSSPTSTVYLSDFDGIEAPPEVLAIDDFLEGYYTQSFGGDGILNVTEDLDSLCVFWNERPSPAAPTRFIAWIYDGSGTLVDSLGMAAPGGCTASAVADGYKVVFDHGTSAVSDYRLMVTGVRGSIPANLEYAGAIFDEVTPGSIRGHAAAADALTVAAVELCSDSASITLSKTGTLNDDDGTAGVSVGDTISYAFTVTNTGNVAVTDITLADTGATVSGGPIASLAVGASDNSTFTASYTITQTDIDAGTYTNTATVTGDGTGTDDVTATDNDTQALAEGASITLSKTGTLNDDDGIPGVSVGDTISYAFTVTNVGDMAVTDITLADPGATVSGGPIASLAEGASDSSAFIGIYTITQTDIDAGTYTNTATVTGDGTGTNDVTATDTDSLSLEANAYPPYSSCSALSIAGYSSDGEEAGNARFFWESDGSGGYTAITNGMAVTKPDVTAAGQSTLKSADSGTTSRANYYGTSASVAATAGIAALYWEYAEGALGIHADFVAEAVRDLLAASVLDGGDTGTDILFGAGVVDAPKPIDDGVGTGVLARPRVSVVLSAKAAGAALQFSAALPAPAGATYSATCTDGGAAITAWTDQTVSPDTAYAVQATPEAEVSCTVTGSIDDGTGGTLTETDTATVTAAAVSETTVSFASDIDQVSVTWSSDAAIADTDMLVVTLTCTNTITGATVVDNVELDESPYVIEAEDGEALDCSVSTSLSVNGGTATAIGDPATETITPDMASGLPIWLLYQATQ